MNTTSILLEKCKGISFYNSYLTKGITELIKLVDDSSEHKSVTFAPVINTTLK